MGHLSYMRHVYSLEVSMKIIMVAHTIYESDNRVMRYAETLVSRNHEVDVISLGRSGQKRDAVVNGVRVLRVQKRRNKEPKITYPFRIIAFLLRAGVILTRLHLRKRYDVVHVHSVPDFMVFSALIPKLTGAKVILDIHDVFPEFFASKFRVAEHSQLFKLLIIVERLSARFADHVLVANHLWEEKLLRRSVPPGKVTTIQNTPDRSVFKRQGRTRSEDGKFILVYPGSLNSHQGVDVAIRAMPAVLDEVPKAELHVYGRGSAREDLVKLAKELAIHNSVYIHAELPSREVAQIIENADVGVEPKRATLFANEAFSTKIYEYMAMGIPAVASNTKVHRHYLDDSLVMFFGDGDSDQLAQCILTLARDPQLRRRYAQNGLQFVDQNNWEAQIPAYLHVLDALTSSASTPITIAVRAPSASDVEKS
jgi:glycosyltransferase involved in cell wall biosynthesis